MSPPKSSRVTLAFGGLGVICLTLTVGAGALDAPELLLTAIALALVGLVVACRADHGGTSRNMVCATGGWITLVTAFFFGVLQTTT